VILILFGCGDKNIKKDLEFVTNSSFFQKNEKYPKLIKEILIPYSIPKNDSFLRFDPIVLSILNTKTNEVKFSEILFKFMKGTSGNPEKIKLYTKKLNEFFDNVTIEKQYTSVYDSSFNYNDALTKYYTKHHKNKCIIIYSDSINSEDSVLFLNQIVYGKDDIQLIRTLILDSLQENPVKKFAILVNPTIINKPIVLNQEIVKTRFTDTSAKISNSDSSTFIINVNGSTDYLVDGKLVKITHDTIFKDGTYTFDIRIKPLVVASITPPPNPPRRNVGSGQKSTPKKFNNNNTRRQNPLPQLPVNRLVPNNSIEKKKITPYEYV
jgi:hypothetical protein